MPDDAATTLQEILDDLLHADFEAHPVAASGLGLTDYDERLDDLTADAHEARLATAAEFLARLDGIGDEGLTVDQQIDRDLARSTLRGRLIEGPFETWKRDPGTYTGPITGGLFSLFLHRLRPEEELVDAAVARLVQAGEAVDAGIANLDPALAHPLIVDRGLRAAQGSVRYVRDLVWLDIDDTRQQERLRLAGLEASEHLARWVAHLADLASTSHGSWQLGEERYTQILREREVLGDDARSLRDRGWQELDRLDRDMAALSREATGSPDYIELLRENDEHHPPSEQAMLDTYAEWTARSRAFLVETGLVTLPEGETCDVVPSPVFQRPILGVASYMSPPSFSDRWTGHFFVPFAPDGASAAEIEGRLAGNSYDMIPTVAVHETYPGHHWHLVTRKSNPSTVRRVYSTPYFNEGWALYAERAMRERGFFEEPMHVLQHLSSSLFRAARIVVDTSLHVGEMSFDEAVEFMRDRAALPEAVARVEVGRYCQWPTQASSYLTGCLAILDIRARYLAARGYDGVGASELPIEVLRDFHDTIAGSGSLPLGLAERAVMASVA